jgi:hypothetical protein
MNKDLHIRCVRASGRPDGLPRSPILTQLSCGVFCDVLRREELPSYPEDCVLPKLLSLTLDAEDECHICRFVLLVQTP